MPSIFLTPPALEPVPLVEAMAHLRVGHDDEDAIISTLIMAARRSVESQTGLSQISQQWQCLWDDWPEDGAIELPVAPVMEVDELATYSDDDVKTVIDPAHYHVDAASRPARLVLWGSRQWLRPGRIANGVAATVTAGFGATASDVPEGLRHAALILVAHWFEHRGNGNPPPPPLTVTALLAPWRELRL